MAIDPDRFFTDADLAAIQRATAAAERRTSGEIVTYVVGRCDGYPELGWIGAALGALAGTSLAAVADVALGWWGAGPVVLALPALAGAAVGFVLAARMPEIGRRLVPEETLAERAQRRAEAAFLEEEVFNTRDRTGILIFLALFEHRAIVLGDSGINAAVDPGAWQGIVADLVSAIRAGRPAQGLQAAVEACGALLEQHRVAPRPDDADELSDAPRVRDR